jgi:hypothetical protein
MIKMQGAVFGTVSDSRTASQAEHERGEGLRFKQRRHSSLVRGTGGALAQKMLVPPNSQSRVRLDEHLDPRRLRPAGALLLDDARLGESCHPPAPLRLVDRYIGPDDFWVQ